MRAAYYEKFERHSHGKGLKGQSTHYCPGCGHGLVHNYIAEAIEKLGIKDRTVAISPVGCSVFMYYYMDVGNSQAAHGRAPVVGLGHKLANPNTVVISYQGDGDLGSIGLAEIVHTAQVGIPLTVIFINNAIYGMTGGQMAPTTLMGQKTATSPKGRNRYCGEPMRIAETIAQLSGPVYVERVALFNTKERAKAKKAIKKALEIQADNRGFAFVEVLSECPTHLKCTPSEAEKWVEEKMVPVFPLGVKKEAIPDKWFEPPTPKFDPKEVLEIVGGSNEAIPKFCKNFPAHIDPVDISMKLAGSGGDGAQTAAMLITQAAIHEEFDSTHIPSYGPESRGGTSYADVHVAKERVHSPASPHPHVLIAFNAPSLTKFAGTVAKGGTIIYDSSVISDPPKVDGVKMYGVPCAEIATDLGKAIVKNIVALGALHAATQIFPKETFLTAIRHALAAKAKLIPLNEQAFELGSKAIKERH